MAIDILIVDDDPDHTELCRLALEECCPADRIATACDIAGVQVQLATLAKQPEPWVVLLDLKLGHESGLDVLRMIRADKALARVPVIVHSSSREERDVRESYAAGANAYVTKSRDLAGLRRTLEGVHRTWLANTPGAR